MRYKITLEYNGTGFDGWQKQPSGNGVQNYVEQALSAFNPEAPGTIVAGRTDAGVHAMGQVISVDLVRDITPMKLCDALNAHLRGRAIVAVMAEIVPDDFSARTSAKRRYYRYVILNRRSPTALLADRVWQFPHRLNLAAMQEGAAHFVGKHDFTSFRSSICQARNPVRTIDAFTVTPHDDQIWFEISARAFLHHQVRNMVGTLVEIGRGKQPPGDIPKMIAAHTRAAAGPTAPACGLYFVKVEYS